MDAVRGLAGSRRGACRRRRSRCGDGGSPSARSFGRRGELARWPAAAVALFLVLSRVTVGEWFVSGGFYERDPTYDAQAGKTLLAIWWGTHRLSGYVIEIVGLAMAAPSSRCGRYGHRRGSRTARDGRALRRRGAAGVRVLRGASVSHSLHGAARIGLRVVLRRGRRIVRRPAPSSTDRGPAGALAAGGDARRVNADRVAAVEHGSAADRRSPVGCSQQPRAAARDGLSGAATITARRSSPAWVRSPTTCRSSPSEGFAIADFIHEGNGALWELALETGPAPHAGWMLVEEKSEGGDVLAEHVRRDHALRSGDDEGV